MSGDAFVVVTNSKAALSANLDAIFENLGQPTLMRIRGEVKMFATGGVVNDDCTLGLGICLANNLATTAAVLPGPITDSDFPWIWHSFSSFRRQTIETSDTPVINTLRLQIDSKAMRRINPAMELFFCAELLNSAGTMDINFMPNFRILLQS